MNETHAVARSIREVMRQGHGLVVRCRDCATSRSPLLENVAARIGYDTPIGPEIVFLCSNCGSRDTSVSLSEKETLLAGVALAPLARTARPVGSQ